MITRKNELKVELLTLHENEIKNKIEVLKKELSLIQEKKRKLLSFPQKGKEESSSNFPEKEEIPMESSSKFDAVAALGGQVPPNSLS